MATNTPTPESSDEGPRYQGRLLPRPEDEVVDQGAGFDVRTVLERRGLMSRRAILGMLGIGVSATALAACAVTDDTGSAGSTGTATADGDLPAGEIPDETAGPYPGDGSNGPDVLEVSGVVRSDLRSSIDGGSTVDGVPLTFTIRVTDMANGDAAFAGVAVYAWHCDAQGRYSMYSEGVEDETWLRGVQVADANGQVTFTSIVPGCYTGRWTHIHFEVYPSVDDIDDSTNAIATSQIAFPESILTDVYQQSAYDGSSRNLAEVSLDSDNVFGEDGGALQMATVTGSVTNGYTASLTARVDTTTAPTSGSVGSGGMPGGGGQGGGRP